MHFGGRCTETVAFFGRKPYLWNPMKPRITHIFSAIVLSLAAALPLPAKGETELLLEKLDQTLAMKATYENYFQERVGMLRSLRNERNTPQQEYEINRKIADEYAAHCLDSAVLYLNRNRELARSLQDPYRQAETDFMLARQYGRAGLHSDALALLSPYHIGNIPEGLEYSFYEASNYLYGELAAYSSDNAMYWQMRDSFRSLMMQTLEEGSYEWYDQKRVQAESDRNTPLALEYAVKALETTQPNTRQYARAAYFVASYQTDDEVKIQYLARSAIADVMCAIKDYASLNELSDLLFRRGDIDRAFQYAVNHCMSDALVFNGRLRQWQIAQFLPTLEQAYTAKSAQSAARLRSMVIVALVLSVLLALLLYFLAVRQRTLVRARKDLEASKAATEQRNRELTEMNGKLHELNGKLKESNTVRQAYIALFLQNLSENMSASRQYKNHVLKYLRRGNDKYLVEEIEAAPPIEDDIRSFNKMFDETFINLYPDFVDKFNGLLADGETITPKRDDILTPELRVFALIKLGITESSKIASLLNLSANTVYNYRAKIKNKARGDRDRFEDAVRSIE